MVVSIDRLNAVILQDAFSSACLARAIRSLVKDETKQNKTEKQRETSAGKFVDRELRETFYFLI